MTGKLMGLALLLLGIMFVQPYKLDEVVEALLNVAPGMTVSDAKGHGHQKGHPMLYRGHEHEVSLVPKTMIEIVADDDRVGDIVKVVRHVVKTGQIGDGRIFVFPIDVPRQEWFHGYRID